MRASIANEIAKGKAVEQTVDGLYDWIDELHSKIETAQQATRAAGKEVKAAEKDELKLESTASKRLNLLGDLKFRFNKVKNHLADKSNQRKALERPEYNQVENQERKSTWLVWRCFQVACTHSSVDI